MSKIKVGGTILGVVLALGLVSLFWLPADPLHVEPAMRLAPLSWEHPLGTDRFGRDVLARIMVGARITITVSVAAAFIAALIGTPLGILAGMRKMDWIDWLIMRGSDLLLAFPALLMAILFGAIWGPSMWSSVLAIGVAGIPGFVRVSRAGTRQIMHQDFIAAARLAGKGSMWITRNHVLPNISTVVIIQFTVALSLAILAEAGLSFLGLGTPPPHASWGTMLQAAQASLGSAPQLALWPGLAITLTVWACTLVGDGLAERKS
ncbi:ABC transporter permease [Corynebacterium caspium]|uniref:ABC transporter permease n=1 Tax=Corynebacterium caspium TaxID=234828 RepID=UPI0003780F4E|nr:ABC transporter permease [Corynebacterium caspium]WKD58873.1 Glutathione transport system permease protein GsiD [Corynebacterium caspium DSM 44850]